MIVTSKVTMGNSTFEFASDEKDEMEGLHRAIVLSSPRSTCNNCKEKGYASKFFTTNKDKEGNIYVNVKCAKCGAKSKLGQYKAGGYFWHEYELYVPPGNGNQSEKEESIEI